MSASPVPRGRHAPPLEVRRQHQRERLFAAAARVIARVGLAEAGAEAISREAGMSKATFYEHFANRDELILALFDVAAEVVRERVATADDEDTGERVRAFLGAVAAFPEQARVLLVEGAGAGPAVSARRDAVVDSFALELAPRFTSPEDAHAATGAIVHLVARQLRQGTPADVAELEPVILRLVAGLQRR